MTDDVKRQIGFLIEQATDSEQRAILLVMMNMNDCLTETSRVNAGLLDAIESLKTQVSTQTIQRRFIVRALDKAMPYLLMVVTGAMGWGYATLTDLSDWRIKHTEYHRLVDKK